MMHVQEKLSSVYPNLYPNLQLGYTDETITYKLSSYVLKVCKCNVARDLSINDMCSRI